jgi:hypothetical protein
MLSNGQKSLLKQAQRQAGLLDAEYRECLETVSGFNTSTAPGFSDRHFDKALAYLEAIFWRKFDSGLVELPASRQAPFRVRGYWAQKNNRFETSRDRYAKNQAGSRVSALEGALAKLGYGEAYCASIREKVTQGKSDPRALNAYGAALERSLKAILERPINKAYEESEGPFYVPDLAATATNAAPGQLNAEIKAVMGKMAEENLPGLVGFVPVFATLAGLREAFPLARFLETEPNTGLFLALVLVRKPEAFPRLACAFSMAFSSEKQAAQSFQFVKGSKPYLLSRELAEQPYPEFPGNQPVGVNENLDRISNN